MNVLHVALLRPFKRKGFPARVQQSSDFGLAPLQLRSHIFRQLGRQRQTNRIQVLGRKGKSLIDALGRHFNRMLQAKGMLRIESYASLNACSNQ